MCQEEECSFAPKASATEPTYYRMAPEARRAVSYFLVPLLSGIVVCIERFARQLVPLWGVLFFCGLFGMLAFVVAHTLRWALRVDDRGIACRQLFRWDLWQWSDFASGRIQKRYPCTLYDPGPGRRWMLPLHLMRPADTKHVIGLVNVHYRLPPPPKLPERIQIKYGSRRAAVFDPNGIHLLVRGKPHEYLWSELERVRIVRTDALRRDFQSLLMVLRDREINLKMAAPGGSINRRGVARHRRKSTSSSG